MPEDKNLDTKDAQEIEEETRQQAILRTAAAYQPPKSPEAREHLEWFRDQKFGLMIHWGLYNQLGLKESWPLVDNNWTKWQFRPGTPNIAVKEMYAKLQRGFLPLRFDPDEWADTAWAAGFRYLVFTTKHHDGFCMWDTKTTDYKVTGSDVPWHTEKNADITRALFDSFRARGMGISAYFSRADFNCPYYWEEGYRWKDGTVRVPSYRPSDKPELWQKFKDFVFAQLKELVTEYGKIDCLWYDGGCDGVMLGLPEMTEELRKYQPWLIGVIRGGRGICEDIVTPELVFPRTAIDVPWEVCTVMGKPRTEFGTNAYTSFGYTFDQTYMTAKEVAQMLLDVVSKGGNLALNLSPQPDGRLPLAAVEQLEILAGWMKIFAPAIHGTRAAAPYRSGKWAYTASRDGKTVNAFYLYGEEKVAPVFYDLPFEKAARRVTDLRSGAELAFTQADGSIRILLPEGIAGREADIADCFAVEI